MRHDQNDTPSVVAHKLTFQRILQSNYLIRLQLAKSCSAFAYKRSHSQAFQFFEFERDLEDVTFIALYYESAMIEKEVTSYAGL